MTFRGSGQMGSSNVSSGGGRGRGTVVGGGGLAAVIIGLVIYFVTGQTGGTSGGALSLPGLEPTGESSATGGDPATDAHLEACTYDQANDGDTVCLIKATTISLDKIWPTLIPNYTAPATKIFSGNVTTGGCGSASSATGPFYCPADSTAYFDPTFFSDMLLQLGGSNENLSKMYVVAHEYGHHIENLTGIIDKASTDREGPESSSVRIELAADCYAGVWATNADNGDDDAALEPITEEQINSVITTATAIGDDEIQQTSGQEVNSESWTHGSSEQRVKWFMIGYNSGDPNSCDTFAGAI